MNMGKKIITYLMYLYIILLPLLPSKYSIKGIPFNGDSILAVIIALYFITVLLFKETRIRFIKGIKNFFTNYLTLFMFIFIVIMFISVSYATDKKVALSETIRFCTYTAMFFIVKYELNEKRIIKNILYVYLTTVSLVGVIGLWEYNFGIGFIQKSEHGVRNRIFSTLENSNNLGAFMILAIFPLIMLALNEKNRRKKVIFSVLSLIAFLNIILSYSRNAWLVFVIGCMILGVIYSWKVIIGLIALGAGSLFVPSISARIMEFSDKTQNLSRIKLWDIAIFMIKDHPIRGIGNGNYRVLYDKYKLQLKQKIEYYPTEKFHPHNILLKVQTELGIFGSLAFIAVMISIIMRCINFIKTVNERFYTPFFKGFMASLIAFMCMNFIDNFFSAPKVIAFFWLLISCFEAYIYKVKKEGDLY